MSDITKRSIVLRGRRTAVSMPDPFWKEIRSMAFEREMSTNEFIEEFDHARRKRGKPGTLSGALVLHAFLHVKAQATGVATPITAAEPLERLQ